jgi:hypothetical protein
VRTIAYTALHYGSDYLDWAIQSIIDHVDEYHVLYSAVGSHGHRTDVPNPDTREQLYALASDAAGSKLIWHDGEWAHEGYQRDSIHTYAPDADVILVLDADEIWSEQLAHNLIANVADGAFNHAKRVRIPIIHYWRSFYRCVLHDPAYPERIILPRHQGATVTATVPALRPINHMGYAQRSEIVEYKQHTHGHKGEWRKDDWFNSIFMDPVRRTDLHPVGSEFWTAEDIDPWDYLPAWMKAHPYADLDIIP